VTVFLDTNILIYAALDDIDDQNKRNRAIRLIDEGSCALSVQVLNEFVVQSTHTKRQNALELDQALAYVKTWRRFPIEELTLQLFEHAAVVMQRGGLSWWDATIVAAAHAQGCEILYSEDMQHGRVIDRLRIVDPFR
jgi:predicted nucleic acid-binding protein